MKLKLSLLILIISNLSFGQKKTTMNIYNIELNTIDNESITLEKFKGKHLLIVNVASECGYTPQYKDLKVLQNNYKDNLVVLGVPCNQFGKQEPGTAIQIKKFCAVTYGVAFLLTEKIAVKGENQHPLYQWLTKKEFNHEFDSGVKWNFEKYLISPEGKLLENFKSKITPLDVSITDYLKK
ncbi:MAG: glutathione peroxidase [Kordia sp.]|nr:MAG: glutathione peroxidase [Kordia sp.]